VESYNGWRACDVQHHLALAHVLQQAKQRRHHCGQPLLVEGTDPDLKIEDNKNNNLNADNLSAWWGVVTAYAGIAAADNRTMLWTITTPKIRKLQGLAGLFEILHN
jgi:hypothetical protein